MTTRREFLLNAVVAGAYLSRSVTYAADITPPRVKNYNAKGLPIVIEGQTLLVEFTFSRPLRSLTGRLPMNIEPASAGGEALEEPQPLHFYAAPDKLTWRAFLTAPLDVIEDVYPLIMDAVAADGQSAELRSDYAARHGVYRNANLTVSKVFSDPPPEVKARQQQDFQETIAALAQRIERRWTQPFILPTRGGYRDNFGDKRTYNRTKRSRHAGIDMTAGMGTPIRAMNDGVIALSADHFAPGQNITLNHGGGVFSKYIHLSRRDAQAGDTVRRGDVIALSGNSGSQKVGPHLHLDIFANGAAVNPLQFMRVAQQLLDAEAGRPVKALT